MRHLFQHPGQGAGDPLILRFLGHLVFYLGQRLGGHEGVDIGAQLALQLGIAFVGDVEGII